MAEARIHNGWTIALASFPLWGTALALIVIEFSGSFTTVFAPGAEYLKLLQDRSVAIGLWIYWMVGSFLLGLIDSQRLQQDGVAMRGWEHALNLLLPPAYFVVRDRAVAAATGRDQPSTGWLLTIWIVAVGCNAVFVGLISADRLLKIAKDSALLLAWVLVVAVLWAVVEWLFARFWKRP